MFKDNKKNFAFSSNSLLYGFILTDVLNNLTLEDLTYIPKPYFKSPEELDKLNETEKTQVKKTMESVRKPLPAFVFLQKTKLFRLEYIKYFTKLNTFYIYHDTKGYYQEITTKEIQLILQHILKKTPLGFFMNLTIYTQTIIDELKASVDLRLEIPENEKNSFCMKNGIFNFQTKTFIKHTHKLFFTHSVPYSYQADATCPLFLHFLQSFTNGYADRVDFLRSWMLLVLLGNKENQKFLYLHGAAKTGKTVFTNVLCALLGKKRVITTSLKQLHQDKFEIYNLIGKSLILIPDAEDFSADVTILKQLVGGDILHARAKYIQGIFEFRAPGNVLLVSNHYFKAKDSSSAVLRRLLYFPANHVIKTSETTKLIEPSDVEADFEGPLCEELPGVFNWVIQWDLKKALEIIADPINTVPSITKEMIKAHEHVNPLIEWMNYNIIPGEGDYLGGEKNKTRGFYGHYRTWCEENSIRAKEPRKFKEDFIHLIRSNPKFTFEEVRRAQGVFFKGICLKKENKEDSLLSNIQEEKMELHNNNEATSLFMAPFKKNGIPTPSWIKEEQEKDQKDCNLIKHEEEEKQLKKDIEYAMDLDTLEDNALIEKDNLEDNALIEKLEHFLYSDSDSEDLQQTESEDLQKKKTPSALQEKNHCTFSNTAEGFVYTEKYIKNVEEYIKWISFENTSFKDLISLGKIKLSPTELQTILENKIKNVNPETITQAFKNKCLKKLEWENKNLENYGLFVSKYGPMGNSPRIQPLIPLPGRSVFSLSGPIKKAAYKILEQRLDKYYGEKGILLDIDLKSCYFSLLLGLFPNETKSLNAFWIKGLWNVLENFFKKQNKKTLYNKSWVKTAIYTTFFSGGQKAMLKSILNEEQQSMGFTAEEFHVWEGYTQLQANACEALNILTKSDVLSAIKKSINNIRNTSMKETKEKICKLRLSSGEIYKFPPEDFSKGLSKILMDYEISIIASSLLEYRTICPSMLILGHFHDGATIYFPHISSLAKLTTIKKEETKNEKTPTFDNEVVDEHKQNKIKEIILKQLNEKLNLVCQELGLGTKLLFESKEI